MMLWGGLSVTRRMKVNRLAAVGVPVKAPLGANVSPSGRLPLASVKTYGDEPPVAAKVSEYGVPMIPFGAGFGVVMVSEGVLTVNVKGFVVVDSKRSVTATVKLNTPTLVGTPVIAPPEEDRDSPPGRAPPARLQKYGCAPPVAFRT